MAGVERASLRHILRPKNRNTEPPYLTVITFYNNKRKVLNTYVLFLRNRYSSICTNIHFVFFDLALEALVLGVKKKVKARSVRFLIRFKPRFSQNFKKIKLRFVRNFAFLTF